jgi:hypothetical protein
MGQELTCSLCCGKRRIKGKALLETAEIIFRASNRSFRLRTAFAEIKSIKAVDGELRIQGSGDLAIFELGAKAEKWCEKILHPKSRFEKLGVKPGANVSLVGEFDKQFISEINACTENTAKGKPSAKSDCIFFAAESAKDLERVPRLVKNIRDAAALWVVYPKGQKHITENDVLSVGRKTGLKDVKVVGFSPTHTALKFVMPLDKR